MFQREKILWSSKCNVISSVSSFIKGFAVTTTTSSMFLHRAMRYYRLWIYSCNLALLFSVLIFVSLAAWILSDHHMALFPYIRYHQPTLVYAYFALALQGGILQAIGCWAAVRMNERFLNVYWSIMLALLVGDVIMGIIWIFHYNHITANLRSDLKSRLQVDYGRELQFQILWDKIQDDAQCCGVDGPRDYNHTFWLRRQRQDFPKYHQMVPLSCCRFKFETRIWESTFQNHTCVESYLESDVYQDGCYDEVQRWLQGSADLLCVLGFCVIAFLKVCFLGILRYEIREMIQKIKILQELEEPSPLLGIDLQYVRPFQNDHHLREISQNNFGNHVLSNNQFPHEPFSKESFKSINGNNNESENWNYNKTSAV
ncbi:tetraspanin-14-like isoform X2 [Tachypleus tridentatus]|uniref:tetraspanin-14-like isoform X2 n=1 Tax=Tachypleus tridentatus TaxID=6853 RepID=UPI003FD5A1FC